MRRPARAEERLLDAYWAGDSAMVVVVVGAAAVVVVVGAAAVVVVVGAVGPFQEDVRNVLSLCNY